MNFTAIVTPIIRRHVFLRVIFAAMIFAAVGAYAAAAAEINNPQAVNMMKTEIVQTGGVEVEGAPMEVSINISVPQRDEFQEVIIEEATHPYRIINDQYGNELLTLTIKNPSRRETFEVRYTVTTYRRTRAESKLLSDFIKGTDLVQPDEPEIESFVKDLRGTDFEKISKLSGWINENIKYDLVYSDVNISAKEILITRSGVCDEFSNLLLSFTRKLGYYSSFVAGFVYPGDVYKTEEFQPHGWAEIYTGEGIVSDPTWAEVGYLDATHIKFANLPDSFWLYTTASARGYGQFHVKLLSTETKIRIIDFEEEPVIKSESALLLDVVGTGFIVAKTDFSSDDCAFTKLVSRSCVQDGEELLEPFKRNDVVYFCGDRSYFSIYKIPPLDIAYRYTCPISIFAYGGSEETLNPVIVPSMGKGDIKLSVSKTSVDTGEKVVAESFGSELFTDVGDYGKDRLIIKAPQSNFSIFAYSNGSLKEERVNVIAKIPIEAEVKFLSESVKLGKDADLLVTVKSESISYRNVTVALQNQSITKLLEPQQTEKFNLKFTPKDASDKTARVFIISEDYSISFSKNIIVIEPEKSFFEKTITAATELIVSFLRSIGFIVVSAAGALSV